MDYAAAAFEDYQASVRKAGNTPNAGTRIAVKHMGTVSEARSRREVAPGPDA